MRKLLKWAALGFGGILIVTIVAAILLPRIYEEKIRIDLEQEIDRHVDADVTFSEVHLKLFRHFPNLTLSLNDLLIKGKEDFKHDTLAAVKEIQLEVRLWSLISKREIELKSVHMVDPEINVYVLKDGKANYDIVKRSADSTSSVPSKPSSMKIAIDKVSIERGKMTYSDWQKNIFAEAIDIEHTGGGDFMRDLFEYETLTTIRQFSLNYDKVQYLFKKTLGIDLIIEMNLPQSKFTFKENQIQINHFVFSIDGFFQQVVDRYAMNVKFKAKETSFKNILSLVPGLYMKNFDYMETRGELGFSGFLDGVYSDSTKELPAFHLDVNVKNAMVKIDSLPEAFNNIQFELVVDNKERILDSTVIDLKTFHVELGRHPVHGRIKVEGLHKPKIDADIFADVDIASLERLFPIRNLTLKGKVNFEFKTKGIFDQRNSVIPLFNLNLKLTDGYARYDSLPRPISNLQFHLNADNKTGKLENTLVDFRQVHAEVDDNVLHGFAKLKGYPDTEIDADIDADLDLEDIEKIYPIDGYQLKGRFNLDVLAKGLYSKDKKKFPMVDSKVKLTDGSIQYRNYPPIKGVRFFAEALSTTGDLADSRLNINKFTYTLEDEPFEITGSLANLNNYEYSFNVNGKADLSKVALVFPMEGIQLSGLIDAQLKTSGLVSDIENKNYSRVNSSGRIIATGVSISGVKVPNPIKINNALFTFTSSKIIMESFEGKFGKSNVKMNGDISNYMAFTTSNKDFIKGDLELTCDTLDLNEWMPPRQTATGKPVPTTDTTHSKLTVIEVPKNLNFVFDSQIHMVKYEDLKIKELDGEISIKDGVMSLHETGFNSLDARFSVNADYNTRDIAHPLFDMDVDVKDLDINRAYREVKLMRDLAPSTANVYGKFSVTYKLKGEFTKDMSPKLETLTGGGIMRIAEAKINGMKLFEEISKSAKKNEINDPHLKDFTMETEIRDSKIIVKPFSIKVSGFDADIEGVNTMNGMVNYLVKIELIPFTKIKIPFHVTGKYDNPKVTLGKGHTLPY
ncbi:MAG: AsmA family protein [Bacteroidetes bacterium]|nr:AsmA family protein [Bacteroidota bacterium]